MHDDLSTVDARQLQVWAYGRQGAGTAPHLAEAAQREIARRAAVARAEAARAEAHALEAERSEADPAAADEDTAPPPLTDEERTHRRRMLATGFTGVAAAALCTLIGVTLLMQPNPDPLAIFDRPATQLDVAWQAQLEMIGYGPSITLGPRVVDFGEGRVGIVFRTAARADGGSTEWDPYCLLITRGVPGTEALTWTGTCVLPDTFNRDGIALPAGLSDGYGGIGIAAWGPTGPPRVERNSSIVQTDGNMHSILDWLTFASVDASSDPLAIIDDPDRLLLGPGMLYLAEDLSNSGVLTNLYVMAGATDGAPPLLCLHTALPNGDALRSCEDLSTVREFGWQIMIVAEGGEWMLGIGADSANHSISLRRVD